MISNKEVSEMLAYSVRPIIFAVIVFTAIPLPADWLCDFGNSVVRDTKRRNCWPEPFNCPDRQAVRAPFAIMVNNGWRRQNMLGEFHFEPTTGQLTEAGKLKIRWIVYEAPEQHRSIYVHIAKTTEETAARMEAVNLLVSTLVPQGEMPQIMQTAIADDGAPADRVDMIGRKYQSSTPVPRLPSPNGQSGSSGSSGGAAQ
jgi:hypothetical protein